MTVKNVCLKEDIRCPTDFLAVRKEMESLPPKVWLIIFLFLPLNDLTEASAVCKIFFGLTRRNSLFTEKLLHSRILFNNSCVIFDCCKNAFLSFYHQLCFSLEKNIPRMKIKAKGKGNYNGKIYYFRVWNHFFLCERSQYCIDMCLYCSKLYIGNKKLSDHIN